MRILWGAGMRFFIRLAIGVIVFSVSYSFLAPFQTFRVQAQKIEVPPDDDKKPNTGRRTFTDTEGGYEVVLEDGWRSEVTIDNSGRRNVEIIFRDRSYALLKAKQEKFTGEKVDADFIRGMIDREIDGDLRFRPDYKPGIQERFVSAGGRGFLIQFTYKRVGKPTTGRFYYIQTAPDTVWVLRFTGEQKFLDPLRYQTDQLSRSFRPLP